MLSSLTSSSRKTLSTLDHSTRDSGPIFSFSFFWKVAKRVNISSTFCQYWSMENPSKTAIPRVWRFFTTFHRHDGKIIMMETILFASKRSFSSSSYFLTQKPYLTSSKKSKHRKSHKMSHFIVFNLSWHQLWSSPMLKYKRVQERQEKSWSLVRFSSHSSTRRLILLLSLEDGEWWMSFESKLLSTVHFVSWLCVNVEHQHKVANFAQTS